MGHKFVDDVQCSDGNSSSSLSIEDDEEAQLCTRLERCATEYLSLSSSGKELILEPATLLEASSTGVAGIDGEFQVDEERPESRPIGGEEVRVEAETDCDELMEIELRSEHELEEEDDWSSDTRRTRTAEPSLEAGGEVRRSMYVEGPNFRLSGQEASEEQAVAHQFRQQHHRAQFCEAPTKIGFASRRMKDYFESFRGSHRGEKRRLYRFFKSTRTELVACLLFSLISSQALIVSRSGSLQVSPASVSNLSHDLIVQQQTTNTVPQQLVHALGLAFTVASLTQVFGHVSGCHLLPSVSLALYVKGHISKGRLASYLVAQMAGSGLGVTLLSLLQSSQISLDEYWHTLRSSQLKYSASVAGPEAQAGELATGHRRKRRHVAVAADDAATGSGESELAVGGSSGGADSSTGGSETILLSIMEQQQHSKLLKRTHPPPPPPHSANPPGPTSFFGDPETSISNKSTYRPSPEAGRQQTTSTEPTFIEQLATTASGASSPPYTIHSTGFTVVSSSTAMNGATTAIADSTNRPSETSEPPNDGSRVSAPSSAPSSSSSPATSTLSTLTRPASSTERSSQSTNTTKRRNKRNRQTQTTTSSSIDELSQFHHKLASGGGGDPDAASSVMQSSWLRGEEEELASKSSVHNPRQPPLAAGHYINLLELSLPSAIMSSDSIRTCINKQIQQQPSATTSAEMMKNESRLATLAFRHCLALSNSSQMFVFQFLATLLVVLAYLVNVDPRRVDLGFKSLSIGMAYFVACLLTIQSAGFYGNPFQLLFLSWLSPGTEWQGEWFVYLITPLIGGLFGAVSHEYIDFTSPRNRNKQLHLRRSFYSLDNLPGADHPQLQQLPVPLDQTFSSSMVQCQMQQQLQAARLQEPAQSQQQQMSEAGASPLATTVLEMSPGSRQLVAAARRSRKASSSNNSLESSGQPGSSSSVISLARGSTLTLANLQHQVLDQQPLRNQTTTGNSRKFDNSSNSYSRRLKMEQQLQLADRKRQVMLPSAQSGASDFLKPANGRTSLRRSDFDSNFLISSSNSATGSSPIANPRQHQVVNSSVGWM